MGGWWRDRGEERYRRGRLRRGECGDSYQIWSATGEERSRRGEEGERAARDRGEGEERERYFLLRYGLQIERGNVKCIKSLYKNK